MKNIKTAICLLFIVILYGCGPAIVNMHDYYKTAACPVTVIDMRPDQRVITGLIGESFDISPPVKDILHSKLCNNKRINEASEANEIFVRIRDLKWHSIIRFFSGESILIIDGSLQYGGKYYEIQTSGKLDYVGGTLSERTSLMLNEAAENFVAAVVDHIK
jgi:hypothetical protein